MIEIMCINIVSLTVYIIPHIYSRKNPYEVSIKLGHSEGLMWQVCGNPIPNQLTAGISILMGGANVVQGVGEGM